MPIAHKEDQRKQPWQPNIDWYSKAFQAITLMEATQLMDDLKPSLQVFIFFFLVYRGKANPKFFQFLQQILILVYLQKDVTVPPKFATEVHLPDGSPVRVVFNAFLQFRWSST